LLKFFILLGQTGPTHSQSQNSGDNLHCSLYRTVESSPNKDEEEGEGEEQRSEGVEEGEEQRK